MEDQCHPDLMLDLSGLQCPLPVLKTAKALQALAPGDIVEIVSTDPMAKIDVPHFCAEQGHELLAQSEQDDHLQFLIRKGGV